MPVQVVAPEDEREHMLLAALARRQLSASQRAALALELADVGALTEEGERRRLGNLRQATEVAGLPPRGKTRELVAAVAGVSARTVQDAQTVQAHDPALFARVKAGALAVDLAARRVRRVLRDAGPPGRTAAPEWPLRAPLRRPALAARRP